ncbi:CorA family divalent cation transporter [Burkholderia sp. LMG 32019]|uniref:CorA family divalent cation transporter n=1 Tax=Burkholderia sp. LMG 32019 TaxID=3158173 RepID=UPI003C2BA5A9
MVTESHVENTAPATVAAAARLPLDRGFLFSPHGIAVEIDAATAIAWLQRDDTPPGEFVWLHFHDIPSVLEGWPLKLADVPAAFGDAVRRGYASTRIMHVRRHLIAVLNDVDYDATRKRALEVATLWVSADDRCLLSVRSATLRSVERLRGEALAAHPFHSPMALLNRLLQEQADALGGIARSAAGTANIADEALLAGKLPKSSSLGHFRRDLVRLRRLLAPEPAALFRLANRPPGWLHEEDAQALRQCAEQFSLVLRDTAGLEERIRLLQDEIVGIVGEHTNRSVLILTSVTVIALPINLIAGLLGMNVGGIPLRDSGMGFSVFLLIALLLTSIAAWLIYRFARN